VGYKQVHASRCNVDYLVSGEQIERLWRAQGFIRNAEHLCGSLGQAASVRVRHGS
jgi:hypothetical protein